MLLGSFLILCLVYVALIFGRGWLAIGQWKTRQQAAKNGTTCLNVRVLQPILSGDPRLRECLELNLKNAPDAGFEWLIDESDEDGRRIAKDILEHSPHTRVTVRLCPDVPDGTNPKTFKLAIAEEALASSPDPPDCIAVLDDDTVLPSGHLAAALNLVGQNRVVTGIPCSEGTGTGWTRLVEAFIDANSLITYLPILKFQSPATLNGMFYVLRCRDLAEKGGFRAIEHELCDDYALARLYQHGGGRIVQSTVFHPIQLSVLGAAHYFQLMQRWMVFTNRLLRESFSFPILVLVVFPGALPTLLLLLGALAGPVPFLVGIGLLLTKCAYHAWLRRRTFGYPFRWRHLIDEMLVDQCVVLLWALALIQPRRIRWRTRDIEMQGHSTIHYRSK